MSAGTEARWACSGTDIVLWARLDGGYAAYHRPSGKTHFLNAETHRLMTQTLLEPLTIEEVVDAFVPDAEPETRAAAHAELLSMLERLEELGMIEKL